MDQVPHGVSRYGNPWWQFSLRSLFLAATFFAVAFTLCRWFSFTPPVIPALGFWLGTIIALVIGLRKRRTSLVVRGTFGGAIGGSIGTLLSGFVIWAIWFPPVETQRDAVISLGIVLVLALFGCFLGGLLGLGLSWFYALSFGPKSDVGDRIKHYEQVRRGRVES